MVGPHESIHGQWSSRWVFILAATGSAVGLGNIWRFPYITGENGGGAFVLIYLVCIALVGLPIMIGETAIGRRGRQSPINTMRSLAQDEGLSPRWSLVGWVGVLAGFIILSFYSVVAGWAMAYVFYLAGGVLVNASAGVAEAQFNTLIGSAWRLLAWHSVFMFITGAIIARGVSGGLEYAVRWLMPALFALLVVVAGYAAVIGDFGAALRYIFEPDFSKLSGDSLLAALGQAFFSLSLGMGAIMVYGAYLPANASIPRTIGVVAISDTLVAMLAGFAIFPIVFAFGLEPGSGPGLVFVTLTVAFGQVPGGHIVGGLFFLLLTVAALTSAISLLEPVVAWLVEARKWSRRRASTVASTTAWLLGIGSLLSFNHWAELTMLGKTFFDWCEFLGTTVMLPMSGLFIAIFAGWRLKRTSMLDEIGLSDGILFALWRFLVRFVAPLGVFAIILNALGLFGADT